MILLHIVLVCLGIRTITDKYMLFEFVRVWALKIESKGRKYKYITKPTITCITCMASFWGLVVCYFYQKVYFIPVTDAYIYESIISIIGASFVQTLLWCVIVYLKYLIKRIDGQLKGNRL
jgi:hypothetical protein